MTERKAAAGVALLQKAVLDALQGANDTTRSEVAAMFDVGDRETAKTPDGTPLGAVRLQKGKTTARITDRQAVIAWCAEHMPALLTDEPEDTSRLAWSLEMMDTLHADDTPHEEALRAVVDAARRWHAYLRSQGTGRDLRAASVKVLTDAMVKGGFIDMATGVVTTVPGITMSTGDPILYVETDKDHAPQVAKRLLQVSGLALEAGDG